MYQRILVPLDGSSTADRGLQEALRLAALTKGQLQLLHVIDVFPVVGETAWVPSTEEMQRNLRGRGEAVLDKGRAAAAAAGVPAQAALREVVQQRVADTIVEEAARQQCDLIVMGTHGRRGLAHLTLGSDAERVLRASKVPVLLIRDPGDA